MSNIYNKSFPISQSALKWLENIFNERYGNIWLLKRDNDGLHLKLKNSDNEIIFDNINNSFTLAGVEQSLSWWNSEAEGWKSILKKPLPMVGVLKKISPLIELKKSNYIIHYDIPGLVYWMLTRLEEIGRKDLDVHARFPATSSHAYKYKYLDRPIIDEWLDLLGQVIKLQWPKIKLKQHSGNTFVTCDIDNPYEFIISSKKLIRRLVGDVVNRRSLRSLTKTIIGSTYASLGNFKFDTFIEGIDFIMQTNENLGRSVAFYFIPEPTHNKYDGEKSIISPNIIKLLKKIYNRGHEIGIHPGYNTYVNSTNMEKSVKTFRRALEACGIKQVLIGGRQHFLRWKTPTTAVLLEKNGLDYDSSLCYADHPGFRCGTCFEYNMFDPIEQKSLKLRQRPLILMETSVIAKHYLGLGYSESALALMKKYRDTCYKFGGCFCLLWHNSHFKNVEDKKFYQEIVF